MPTVRGWSKFKIMIKIDFICTNDEFKNDYMDIVRAFYPYVSAEEGADKLCLSLERKNEFEYVCDIDFKDKKAKESFCIDKRFLPSCDDEQYQIKYRAQIKRNSKVALYDFLSNLTGVKLPYGSLTGIRPTKLYHELIEKGINADEYFMNTLKVSEEKTSLVKDICSNQREFYCVGQNEIDLFVNIPICVSRCVYCSFISAQLDKVKKLVTPYTDLLVKEIELSKKLVKSLGLKIRSVYIGGGTPTSLDEKNFERVVRAAAVDCREYTVEAGRPDTINSEKLRIMVDAGVTRISVNPQTFNQKTLDIIGRKHTVDDIYKVYDEARKYSFDINTDLIAMLPEENFDDFKYSLDCALKLSPENITVHTLALKKGSTLKVEGYDNTSEDTANRMVDYARDTLCGGGYSPYYMYKQKYMSGNLENVGYCKSKKACIYNIDIMEEICGIMANGAGGISKRLFSKDRLERLANPKGIEIYLQREEKILKDKEEFFSLKF